jgi:CubicO group peptidase (beta-lactamase class C family)
MSETASERNRPVGMPGAGLRPEEPVPPWDVVPPESEGLRSAGLEDITAFAAETDPALRGVVVVRHGAIVFERYFQGFHAASLHTVNSITKSVLSALVGIALERRLLPGLELPVAEYFPEVNDPRVDPWVRTITLRHLLTMTAGWGPFHLMDAFTSDPALVRTALQRPLRHAPGETFCYDNLSAHLVSVLLARVTSQSTAQCAHQWLLGPLGIWTADPPRFRWQTGQDGPHRWHQYERWDEATGLPWKVDHHGDATGHAGLHLTVRDLARFGLLYLQHGQWQGVQLGPADYLEESLRPHSFGSAGSVPPTAYGYYWWLPQSLIGPGTAGAYFAQGFGSQYLFVLPQLELVVAITSAGAGPGDMRGPHDPARIVDQFVLPAVRA